MGNRSFFNALHDREGDFLLATVLEGPAQGERVLLRNTAPVWPEELPAFWGEHLPALAAVTSSGILESAGQSIFVERFGAAPQLVVCGGGHVGASVVRLAKLLGLPEDATEEQITEALTTALAELKKLKEGGKEPLPGSEETVANKAVCELLGLKSGAATSDVTAKIMELKGGIVDGVNLREKVEKLEKAAAQRDADEAVTKALKAGKITPAQKEWAVSYALNDPKGFADFAAKAPQVVPMDQIIPDALDTPAGGIDGATRLGCKQLGINEEDVKKYGMKEEA